MSMTAEQIDALRNPTHEKAMKFWNYALLGQPEPNAPLAGLHKARLQWSQATAGMRLESRMWLVSHGFRA